MFNDKCLGVRLLAVPAWLMAGGKPTVSSH
jgi:hypothetical protein